MEAATETVVVLTKKALNEFIGWTTSRYNNYLGYGTKREAVLTAFESLSRGHKVEVSVYTKDTKFFKKGTIQMRKEPEITEFFIQCASPQGENAPCKRGSKNSYWSTKQAGDVYIIDCINKTVTAQNSKRIIKFA